MKLNDDFQCQAWIFLTGSSASTATTLCFLYVLARFPIFIHHVKEEGADPDVVVRLTTFYNLNASRVHCCRITVVYLTPHRLYRWLGLCFDSCSPSRYWFLLSTAFKVHMESSPIPFGLVSETGVFRPSELTCIPRLSTCSGWYRLLHLIHHHSPRKRCLPLRYQPLTPLLLARYSFLVPPHEKQATDQKDHQCLLNLTFQLHMYHPLPYLPVPPSDAIVIAGDPHLQLHHDFLHPQIYRHFNTHCPQTMPPRQHHSTKLKIYPPKRGGMPTKRKKWSKIYLIQNRRMYLIGIRMVRYQSRHDHILHYGATLYLIYILMYVSYFVCHGQVFMHGNCRL